MGDNLLGLLQATGIGPPLLLIQLMQLRRLRRSQMIHEPEVGPGQIAAHPRWLL